MPASNSTDRRWRKMFFTWMMAANMWMGSDPMADPFRMAEEQAATIFHLSLREQPATALPTDKKLVA